MYKVLLFAGTTEGRELCGYLAGCGVQVTACVATEYGQTLIDGQPNVRVHSGRLDEEQMEALMRQDFSMVIDATHPYAAVVSENILAAANCRGLPCYRCLRQESRLSDRQQVLWAEDTAAAVRMLGQIEGNILLTTGSKELAAYASVPGFAQRVYPRVLPLAPVVESCLKLGVPAGHLIAMQGPFSTELNLAMIRQWNIRCLVTKESGRAGGFEEKAEAARQADIPLLVIGRPQEQNALHFSPEQLKRELYTRWGIAPPERKQVPYFPMFVPLAGKRVQVFGAGKIAARRIHTLSLFGCNIEVVAPQLSQCSRELYEQGVFVWRQRPYERGECAADLCLAATDNGDVNAQIAAECRQKGILFNRCDLRAGCDFYFPAVVEHDGVIIGLGSDGSDHKKVKETAARIRHCLQTPETIE